jgi:hypothetical protein
MDVEHPFGGEISTEQPGRYRTDVFYVLSYDLVDDYLERRAPLREAHLKLAREAHERGELYMAGALAEPADRALLVFKTDDPSVPERFAKADPYVLNGLIKNWTVRKWTVVIGAD